LEKFFKFIDRVNALAFFTGVVLATGLLLWAVGSWLWEGKAKTSVVVPNASAEKSEVLSLTAWEFIPETGVQVLKLQSTGGEANEYASEGRGYKTRNLLFVKSDGSASTWLFPDQSHLMSRVERLTEPSGRTKAIFFESRSASDKTVSTFGVYLARPEGSIPVEVLHDITHLVSKRISGDYIHIVYQKYLEIKEARISLKSFESVTDKTIANLVKIP
jgi:hypothetical protein